MSELVTLSIQYLYMGTRWARNGHERAQTLIKKGLPEDKPLIFLQKFGGPART